MGQKTTFQEIMAENIPKLKKIPNYTSMKLREHNAG